MKVTRKLKKFVALFMALIVMMSGISIPANAAGEGKERNVLTFTVKNESGKPLENVELDIYARDVRTYTNLKSKEEGKVRWSVEPYWDVYVGQELVIKPVDPKNVAVKPITFVLGFDGMYMHIETINGKPASDVKDLELVLKGTSTESEVDKKKLVINVKDRKGNPVSDCAFVVKDAAFPNAQDGQMKYPKNGVLKVSLTDSMQEGGEIRIHSASKNEYTGESISFTSKKKEFLTVNGEAYDGLKKYTIVVTKKGTEPEIPEVNKTALEKAIAEAKAIENKNYTEVSWKVLQEAIKTAEGVYGNVEATQAEVNAQVAALKEAVKGLEKKVVINSNPDKPNKPNQSHIPKTSDMTPIVSYTVGMFFAVGIVLAVLKRKNV